MKIKIDKLIYEGWGLGRNKDEKFVFVKKSVPGDLLEVGEIREKSNFLQAKIKKVLQKSNDRVKPDCSQFELCGGCDHQNISYEKQLQFKEEIFQETLKRATINLQPDKILSGSPNNFYYRNVIRFFLDIDHENNLQYFMHNYDYQSKMVQIEQCFLLSEKSNQILNSFKEFVNKNIYDKSSFWQIRIRHGKQTNEYMIELITDKSTLPEENGIVNCFLRNFPEIKSIYHSFSPDRDLKRQKRRLIFGSPIIYEKIGHYRFQISPESFFQTNSLGIRKLYDIIKEYADIKIGESLLDLYCGTGSIGIYLSTLAKEVIGVEVVSEAIKDAVGNAQLNHIKNCKFVAEDANEYLRTTDKVFDVIIVDPPRRGLNRDLIRRLELIKFDRLIYVSCNPATFARDINFLKDHGVILKKVQPIDMFPHTHHIECVGLLKKPKKPKDAAGEAI